MESTKPAALPNFGSLGRTVTKAFRFRRSATSSAISSSVASDEDISIHKLKLKQNLSFSGVLSDLGGFDKAKQDKKHQRSSQDLDVEPLLANMFTCISAIKAAYCQLQIAQIPYDPDKIQSADLAIISELNRISEMKQKYVKSLCGKPKVSESQAALVQMNERLDLIKTYQVTINKLEADFKLKDSEILVLQAKLLEFEQQNEALEGKIHPRRSLATLDNLHLSGLNSTHFLTLLRYTFRSIRSFVSLMTKEMESAGWDLDAAAGAIQPDVLHSKKPEHRQYAFESYVCQKMFSDFHQKSFGIAALEDRWMWDGQKFFKEFTKLKAVNLKLNLNHHLPVSDFYKAKYLSVVHPKMELSFFGDLQYREMFNSGKGFPDSPLFTEFLNMAKNIWMLHCLFFSFEPESSRSIFQVHRGTQFSEVYMECISVDDFYINDCITGNQALTVGFTVVPGFKFHQTVIQSKVYLTSSGSKSNQGSYLDH